MCTTCFNIQKAYFSSAYLFPLIFTANSDYFPNFDVYGSVLRKYIPVCVQQDATLHSLFISGNCSTCFGCYFHPSSGAHTTVSTASGICQTVAAGSSNGVTNTRCCRYSCMRSRCWVEVTPETCRAVSR